MKYCSHCGKQLFDDAVICPGCGCEAGVRNMGSVYGNGNSTGRYAGSDYRGRTNGGVANTGNTAQNTYVRNGASYNGNYLSVDRRYSQQAMAYPYSEADNALIVKISERLKINGIIWIVIASLQILIGLGALTIAVGIMPLILGIVNLMGGINDLNFSKSILSNPVGIVARIEPLTRNVLAMVFNIFMGALIGIAGSLYYFLGIRMLVMDNKGTLLDIENRVQSRPAP